MSFLRHRRKHAGSLKGKQGRGGDSRIDWLEGWMDPGTRTVRQGGFPLRLFSNGEPGPTDSFGLLGSQTLREYISVVLSHPNVWCFAMVAIGEIVESWREHHAGGQYCLTLCDPCGLQPIRLPCPRDSPGKKTRKGLPFPSPGESSWPRA